MSYVCVTLVHLIFAYWGIILSFYVNANKNKLLCTVLCVVDDFPARFTMLRQAAR